MTRLDDRIREGLRDAGPAAAPDLGELTDDITRRRHHRDTIRRLQAGAVGLGVVVVLIVGFSFALMRARQDDPPATTTPTPTATDSDQAVMIAGVPFPVCHPMTIPGSFGDGLDTLWVIEREPGPDDDCSLKEGFQYLGVGTLTEVTILSDEIHDIGQADSHALWPYATPDIDGDGVDEIAIGIAGWRSEGYALVVPFQVTDDAIGPVTIDCGPACRPVPWIGLGAFVESLSGAYCGSEGFVRWSASEGRVVGTSWSLERDRLVRGEEVFDRPDTGSDYPPDGMTELCGSTPTFPEDFENYPDEPYRSPSPEPEPASEGKDIGIGTNVCQASRLGGLDLVPDDTLDVAWTGYLVKDDGTCPDRNPEAQDWVVAVDLTGDGIADTWTDLPLVNCPYIGCEPRGAGDLDADGDEELVVSTMFTIIDHGYFSVAAGDGGYSIAPIDVAAPGHPEADIFPGEPLVTATGGDAGYSAWMRCEGYPEAPVLVLAYVESVVDGNQPALWHEVKLQLQEDGLFHVVDATDLSIPVGDDPGFVRSDGPACGIDFTPL